MAMNSLLCKLLKLVRSLRSDRRGNVAVIFGLTVIPVAGLVGAAVDYSRANSARSAVQASLDSTALLLSKEIYKETTPPTDTQLSAKADSYFKAMYARPEAPSIAVSAKFTPSSRTLVVTGSGTMATTVTRVLGQHQMNIGSSTTIKWGMSRLRVALALDTTGSMSDAGKIDALKTATKGLLSTLKAAATNSDDVYVSIIPFSKGVNVGKSNYTAAWLDWEDWDDDNGHDQSTTTCASQKTGKSGKKKKKCTTTSTWVPDNHNTWNGCVTDRDQNYDQLVTLPTTPETRFPAEQYDQCSKPMMGLSNNWTDMNTLVESLSPAGTTNQPIGLVWAWQSLVGGGPLTVPPKDPNYPYQEIIILMSDGLNTEDRWHDFQNPNPDVDKRMYNSANGSGTCKNIKDVKDASGKPIYTVYTVHVNTDGDPQSQLLKNCATDQDKFFHLTSANQLVTTFNKIGTDLSKLRIAQ